jgi:serine/threonine protein kinase
VEPGRFEIAVEDIKILEICSHILKEQIDIIYQICERYGTEEDEVRRYNVYMIDYVSGRKILKKSDCRELLNYESYLSQYKFNVPKYYGKYDDGNDIWILLENIDGNDLRNMTNKLAVSAADTIAEIQNRFWNCKDRERFDIYWDRINRRYQFIKNEPDIGEAYKLFLERQRTCPRTMSNGDFLEFNAISTNDIVYIIDWGFGGVMPYSLDIARFIAHGTENKATFPFYMNDEQKKLFVRRVYNNLTQKPEFEQYISDIKLAVLNEYVEFVEANEDDEKWYFQHSQKLAKDIIDSKKITVCRDNDLNY